MKRIRLISRDGDHSEGWASDGVYQQWRLLTSCRNHGQRKPGHDILNKTFCWVWTLGQQTMTTTFSGGSRDLWWTVQWSTHCHSFWTDVVKLVSLSYAVQGQRERQKVQNVQWSKDFKQQFSSPKFMAARAEMTTELSSLAMCIKDRTVKGTNRLPHMR